jgi:hypothetical protein
MSKIIAQARDGKPTTALILVETFIVSDLKDRHLNMPIRLPAERGMALVRPKVLKIYLYH